ncbi:hypothetical protein GWR56_07810 [Mucilaginibacter sp. 14171R-50]|uniref:hypothetical protein n=1 Tax=Mucilaginibacter sp. 14171R-50 TaxID=2703789 RepID=UPI00138B8D22|nr:hypothetical protein [Mucilaginibacter sp. 14171R-50]QHS55450.1 hypothetical protein GWR56_07810 [Mucilaginibacter sp. 14171R-50]
MKTTYPRIATNNNRRPVSLPVLILLLLAITGSVTPALAQRGNLSDWRVPPPLPPGTITKGTTTGKSGTEQSVSLILIDIPGVALPLVSPVKSPVLAAISRVSPAVNNPDQPAATSTIAASADIPLPVAPDMPPLPQLSLQDAAVPATIEVPMPEEPQMPPAPKQPVSSGANSTQRAILLMPDIVTPSPLSLPAGNGLIPWPIPDDPIIQVFYYQYSTQQKH